MKNNPNNQEFNFLSESSSDNSPLLRGCHEVARVMTKDITGIINSNFIIKSNPKLKPRAQKFAKEMTLPEKIIWFQILSKKQLNGLKFTKQKQIFSYILDFYCSELLVCIEVDGQSHNEQIEYDISRTKFLNSLGIRIIRICNDDAINNLSAVQSYLQSEVKPQPFRDSALVRENFD